MRSRRAIRVRLSAVILSVDEGLPRILCVGPARAEMPEIPAGPLHPDRDATLELALRRLVREQSGLDLGYVEQLYTFGDLSRDPSHRLLSVAYLALARRSEIASAAAELSWVDGYALLPWEDWREGKPVVLGPRVATELEKWAGRDPGRRERAEVTFGLGVSAWDAHRVLERYELLYEAGLVFERWRDDERGNKARPSLGQPMALDHRRMVATALGRIRGKLAYRPVVFELLPPEFTLSELQSVVEALGGSILHKSNFRRLVEGGGLVEETGELRTQRRGRPAALYCFRRDVIRERPSPGVRTRST